MIIQILQCIGAEIMDGDLFFGGIFLWVLSLLVLSLIIRSAIDGSKTSRKMDILIDEVRMLRKEIKDNKHIIDKRA
jgi:hypothetical protein